MNDHPSLDLLIRLLSDALSPEEEAQLSRQLQNDVVLADLYRQLLDIWTARPSSSAAFDSTQAFNRLRRLLMNDAF